MPQLSIHINEAMKISFSVVVIDVSFVLRYNKTPTRTGRGLVCHFFEWFLFNYEKINQDNRGHYITDALPFLSHITTLLLDESYIAEIWILEPVAEVFCNTLGVAKLMLVPDTIPSTAVP